MKETEQARVLIADENASIAHLEGAIATMCGCSVDVVCSGPLALEKLTSHEYDVILLGSPFPLGGELVLDRLTNELRAEASRTIVVTSYVNDHTLLSRAARAGVYAVLAKPFDVAVLSELVTECVRNVGQPVPTAWIGIPPRTVRLATGAFSDDGPGTELRASAF